MKNIVGLLIFKKEATGKGGTPMICYKIKTMIEHNFSEEFQMETDTLGKYQNNPYIIEKRARMRKYRIDELPQIYNIYNGDMALVGIRPKTKQERMKQGYKDIYEKAIQHKPGFLGINYAFAHLLKHRDSAVQPHILDTYYLNSCEKHGKFITDCIYGYMIVKNIIREGVRSK